MRLLGPGVHARHQSKCARDYEDREGHHQRFPGAARLLLRQVRREVDDQVDEYHLDQCAFELAQAINSHPSREFLARIERVEHETKGDGEREYE